MVLTTCDTNVVATWIVLATNVCGGSAFVSSIPQSGAAFLPNSTNTVLCLATDGCGNTNTCTFTITVLRPVLGELRITLSGSTAILEWSDGILQHADNVLGPWSDVPDALPPSLTVPIVSQEFYRLRCNAP